MADFIGTDGNETLTGTTGDDTVTALGGSDAIVLTAGHDTLDGGSGDDRLYGTVSNFLGAGPHSYTVTANRISDSSGTLDTTFNGVERVSFTDVSNQNVTLDATGFAGTTLTVSVGAGNHVLTGSATADGFNLWYAASATIDGGAGNDSLFAATQSSQDAPITITRSGDQVLFDGPNHSISVRNVESLYVYEDASYGSLFVDASQCDVSMNFIGSGSADTAVGGSAADTFQGFVGNSALAGMGGADAFFFNISFSGGVTILDLAADDTIKLVSQTGLTSFIGIGDFTGVAGQYRYYSWQGQTFIVADSNGDGSGDHTYTLANGAFTLGEIAPGSNVLQITAVLPLPNPGPDVIAGTSGDDRIESGAGDDQVDGLGGNDLIDGGADDDHIDGGAGDDELHGGAGDDTIDGRDGIDSIHGEDGNDTLIGTGGIGDWMNGGAGDDVLTASDGAFNMFGEDGADRITLTRGQGGWLSGGDGNDVIRASGQGGLDVNGGNGDDRITLTGFTDGNVNLGFGDDVLSLGAGYFTISMSTGWPGDGQDTVVINRIGEGFITLIGFAAGEQGDRLDLSIYGADPFGNGTLVMEANGFEAVIDHPASGMRYVLQGVSPSNLSAYNLGVPNPYYAPVDTTQDDAFAEYPDIDWSGELVGADGNDTIRGWAGNDVLYGSGGKDALEGGTGDDVLDGGSGRDHMSGGLGDDVFTVDTRGDIASELAGEGYDTVRSSVSFALAGQDIERLELTGSSAIDGWGNALGNVLQGNGAANLLDGKEGDDDLLGLGGDDRLLGGTGDDVLNGGAGNDVLHGQAGSDEMRGSAGDDIYYVDAAGDTVIEGNGAGWDVVRAGVDYVLTNNVEELSLAGAARVGAGNALANTVFGSGGGDTLSGLAGDDILRGNDGRDVLLGGEGADLLDGGAGKDTLTGGAGRDVYQFRDGDFGTTRSLADTITDFSHADKEKISLNLVDADTVTAGDQAFAWLGTGAFTHVAGQLHYAQAGGNTYVEGDVNGDGTADFVIALTGLVNLVASDFVL